MGGLNRGALPRRRTKLSVPLEQPFANHDLIFSDDARANPIAEGADSGACVGRPPSTTSLRSLRPRIHESSGSVDRWRPGWAALIRPCPPRAVPPRSSGSLCPRPGAVDVSRLGGPSQAVPSLHDPIVNRHPTGASGQLRRRLETGLAAGWVRESVRAGVVTVLVYLLVFREQPALSDGTVSADGDRGAPPAALHRVFPAAQLPFFRPRIVAWATPGAFC